MTDEMRQALIQRVEERLAGCELELHQFRRMSEAELDVLARLEQGWGPQPVHTLQATDPQAYPRLTTASSQGCTPIPPQGGCGQVAA